MSLKSSFSQKQEPGAMILGLIQELTPPMQLLLSQALWLSVRQVSCTLAVPERSPSSVGSTTQQHSTRPALHKLPQTQAMRQPQLKSSGMLHILHPMDLPTTLRSACLPKHVRRAPAQDYCTDTAASPHHSRPPVCQYQIRLLTCTNTQGTNMPVLTRTS